MGDGKSTLDLSGCNNGLWLVKVPKYISERWEKADSSREIGHLKIGQRFGKPDIAFSMKGKLADLKMKEDDTGIPAENKFHILSASDRTLMVFSERNDEMSEQGDSSSKSDIAIEGKVASRLECRPLADDLYMKMKRTHFENAHKPTRMTKLEDRVQTFKPIKNHIGNIEYDKRKKEEGKRSRMDKDKVQDILFNAFEKHQYYAFKDLVGLTQQPSPYLKEILKEIGIYNMRAPHKQMWELKPEYRHYTEGDKKEDTR
ncbi:general transcription factor IIF subunit 2-like [Asterias rubens]|uniref:general transcription factor IIF subunit 2-like n=1 Tax=Asterias rubens TaxID=7604 RepID=UPI001455BCAA|nr:general transcription factor IIF subunit 2-like [Asterias rubens]